MAQKKCPLCGGKILHGECIECGFSVPDEDKLSAPYNLDPEDDRPDSFEPAPEKYDMPEARPFEAPDFGGNAAPVKEKTTAQAPNIKVLPTQNLSPQSPAQQGWQNPYGNSPVQRNTPQNTPQNNPQQGWQNPYNQNPTNNSSNGGAFSNSDRILLIGLGILLLMSFGSPLFGIVGLILSKNLGGKLGEGASKAFKILFTLALLISLFLR